MKKTIVLLQNEQNNQAIETTIKNESEMNCTPNPGQNQERGIFHEIHI